MIALPFESKLSEGWSSCSEKKLRKSFRGTLLHEQFTFTSMPAYEVSGLHGNIHSQRISGPANGLYRLPDGRSSYSSCKYCWGLCWIWAHVKLLNFLWQSSRRVQVDAFCRNPKKCEKCSPSAINLTSAGAQNLAAVHSKFMKMMSLITR